ncbi:hypothetical protein FBQ97_07235 [Acidobacteria bacterium ACD]|nr:MAG: hypothetical protein EDX89_01185 [Acidobacteriota bacterium]MCE7958628.1 hypothetical protein [Acidobacteria bacterium ACB2]MDL1949591.1 hypothetical protein [Acidobacteria bacterium ACD]
MRRTSPLLTALFLAVLSLAAPSARGQEEETPPPDPGRPARASRFTFGGTLGFGFGDVNWVSVTGELGYFATERLWLGTTGTFAFTSDRRYEPTWNSTDYGVGAWARYFVLDRLFVETEWSWTSYEVLERSGSTGRDDVSSLFLGAGYGQTLGGKSLLLVEVLYDVTGNAEGLYGTPWRYRIGFVTGF